MSGIDPQREAQLARDRLLGWSLSCPLIDPGVQLGRDVQLQAGPNGLDFARVKGMEALTQALSVAITTARGDDIFNIAFGFDGLNAMAEEQDPLLARERIRVGIVQVLSREPRVRNILDVKLLDGRLSLDSSGEFVDAGDAAAALEARTRREISVGVSFQAISGEQSRFDLRTLGTNG